MRVLIVDDSRDSARVMAWMVEMAGHTTHTAHDGAGAIAAAESFRPHAVLMDVSLPDMRGSEAAARIRAIEPLSGVAVIGVSGHRREDLHPGELESFDHYLMKPVHPQALASLLAPLRPIAAESR